MRTSVAAAPAAAPPSPDAPGWKPLPVAIAGTDEKESLDDEPQAAPGPIASRAQPGESSDSASRDGLPVVPADDRATPPGTVIVPAKIPDPVLPARLRTPPAATSNVALTRDTQTLTPLPGNGPPGNEPPASKPSDSAPPEEPTRNERP